MAHTSTALFALFVGLGVCSSGNINFGVIGNVSLNNYGRISTGETLVKRGNQYIIGNTIYDIPADHKSFIDAVDAHSKRMTEIGNEMSAIGAKMSNAWQDGTMALRQRQMAEKSTQMNLERMEMNKKTNLLIMKVASDLRNGILKVSSTNQAPLSTTSVQYNTDAELLSIGNIQGIMGGGCHNQNTINGFTVTSWGRRPNGEVVASTLEKYIIGNKIYAVPDDHKMLIKRAHAQSEKIFKMIDTTRNSGPGMWRETATLEGYCKNILNQIEQDLSNGKLKASKADGGQIMPQAEDVSKPVTSTGDLALIEADDTGSLGSEGDDTEPSSPTIHYGILYNGKQLSRKGNKYNIDLNVYNIPSSQKQLADSVQESKVKVADAENNIRNIQLEIDEINNKFKNAWGWFSKRNIQNELNSAKKRLNAEIKKKDSTKQAMEDDTKKLIKQVNDGLKSGNLKPIKTSSSMPVTSSQPSAYSQGVEFAQNPVFHIDSDQPSSVGNEKDNSELSSVKPDESVITEFMKIDLAGKMYTINGLKYQIPANHIRMLNTILDRSKEVKKIAAEYKVFGPAGSRDEIRALGDNIRSRGDERRREGDTIREEGNQIRARGFSMRNSRNRMQADVVIQQGDERRAEGDRVRAEGDRIREVGDNVRSQAEAMRSDQQNLSSTIAGDLVNGRMKPV